jgi:FkbM family methyltransferase
MGAMSEHPASPMSAPGDPITVIDVGARWGISDRWRSLEPDVRVYGFDPDADECRRLNDQAAAEGDRIVTYVPLALGPRAGRATLHVTAEPACSSLYPPIGVLTDHVSDLECAAEVGTVEVDLVTLDGWCRDNGVERVDMIKLDTQGSELGVLEGARGALRRCQLLEIEVELNPIYSGQPLFGDVDAFLRPLGFALWKLDNLVHYTRGSAGDREPVVMTTFFDSKPTTVPNPGGQLYWAHAYYARAEHCLASDGHLELEDARRAAAVAEAMGLHDLSTTIRHLAAR